jgi:transmembrane sensor
MDASDRRKRAAEEAAEWWVALQRDVSRAEREQYVDWLRESPVHVAEMLHVAQVHGALEQFQRWSGIPVDGARDENETVVTLPTSQPRPEMKRNTPTRRRSRPLLWAVAAMLIVGTGIASMWLMDSRGRTIQTDRGERREVALSDGSVVQVDPETLLRVKYEDHARRVYLDHGRALFHVAKNSERPFLVEANDTMVRAVGTAFAVERRSESVVVTVSEGKVAVLSVHAGATPVHSTAVGSAELQDKLSPAASGNEPTQRAGQSAAPQTLTGSAPEILLTANQQVTVPASGSAEPVRVVDSGRMLAWADGRLVFENTPLADAIRQFNRYNRIQIVVNDQELASRPISGVFNAADPESFAAFIQSVARVHVSRTDGADITIDVDRAK